jgi:glycosyltransferase involved in cell wall biosynthesis
MNVLVALLKFPPDFTGAGQRIQTMYSRLLENNAVENVFVMATTSRDLKEVVLNQGKLNIFFVSRNLYIGGKRSIIRRLKKALYIACASWTFVRQYINLRHKIDMVHTIDSSWVSTLIGWLAFLSRKPLIKEIVLIGTDDPETIRKEKGWLLASIFLRPFHYARLIITISDPLKDICVREGFSAQKIWVRHNPVYVENINENGVVCFSSLNEREIDRKNILFVGTLIERKNLEFLLHSARFLHGNVNLLFAGPAEDIDYFRRLQIFAAKLKRETDDRINVRFLGWIQDRKKLAGLYLKSDLSWFASLQEGMGNVIIESLLYGTPVVTLPVCGIMRTIIQSPNDGSVVDDNCPQTFADVVNQYLYRVKIDRKSLIERSRKRFDPSMIEQQYVAHFKKMAGK